MSKKTKKFEMTAVVFRNIFSGLLVLLFAVAITLVVFGTNILKTTTKDVRTVVEEANTIDQTNTRIITLWNELQKNKNTVEKANRVVADSKSYIYQDVIVNDLNNFAQQAGIKITNYDFTVSPASSGETSTPQTQASTEAPITPESATTASPSPAATLKTTSVNVSVETPVDYGKLLNFIHYIEQNLTKMQISKVSLSRVAQDNPQSVNTDALNIEVYIR